ncbi:MAG: DUF554 domain-containing protein [Clostridia bacterium]|nr:DUF554 domain-containing protein [Oscillospiraceae bacterium]MBQ6701792.1 DUF554 domain-containing protein [Clostridia bacterium]
MIGLGTIINVAAILLGGLIGWLFGRFLKESLQNAIVRSTGICVMFIGMSGALEKILSVNEEGKLTSGGTLMMIGSMAIGTLIGELIDIDGLIEKFGNWLKKKTGNAKDNNFVEGFVTASITVCVGAMTVVGSIEDGIDGDYTTLLVKSLLDFIIIIVMTSTLGKGCVFSAIPVAIIQGGFTLGAKLIEPYMTEAALHNLSLVGSLLIFCVGLNLLRKNSVKVANMLPAIIVAVMWAFFQ